MPDETLPLQQQKAELEVRKLKQDVGWRSLAVPLASMVFGAATIFFSIMTYRAAQEKSAQDHVIACTNSAISVSKVIDEARSQIDRMSTMKDKVNRADEIMGTFPPQAAMIMGLSLFNHLGDQSADALMLRQKIKDIVSKYPEVLACRPLMLLDDKKD
ncbi:MAG: hypothetical protein JSS43_16475 [Proteobacteria bacterium]|nr:hypothetical protein [Pseudomonadota bacterium]